MELVYQRISNHPLLDVIREVCIIGFNVNGDAQEIEFFYRMRYLTTGEEQDVTSQLSSQVSKWLIDNSTLTQILDDDYMPIVNPDYVEELDQHGVVSNEIEMYMTYPSFTYFLKVIMDQCDFKNFMINYLLIADAEGRFNF